MMTLAADVREIRRTPSFCSLCNARGSSQRSACRTHSKKVSAPTSSLALPTDTGAMVRKALRVSQSELWKVISYPDSRLDVFSRSQKALKCSGNSPSERMNGAKSSARKSACSIGL